tara:strand:- start:243 stop:977 length:735 start_codon:yes stop_codon:yes gene_type:complete
MASIQQVYNTLRDLTNKEQKGFITPMVFNSLAHVAQMNVYNEFFTELVEAKKLSRQGFELGRDKSLRKQKLEDLSYFVKKTAINSSGNIFEKPYDLSKIISINIYNSIESGEVTSATVRNSCEVLYDIEKANYILGSNLSTPTRDFPVALVAENIEVFPASVNRIELTYYKNPTSWKFGTKEASPLLPNYSTQIGGAADPLNMMDFMLPNHCVPELVSEMAKLLGLRLRDPSIQVVASREEAAE